jgi:Family of unknown function (DUF6011)
MKTDFDEVNELLIRPNADTFENCRAFVAPFFEHRKQAIAQKQEGLPEGVEFRQRPVIALRLFDSKLDKIVIRPCWTSKASSGYQIGGTLNPQAITLELLRDHPISRGSRLDMRISPVIPRAWRISTKTQVNMDNVKYVVDRLKDFLADPEAFFVRRGNWCKCCCCGKDLTDQLSVSRGIGPECIKVFDYFKKGILQ